VSRDAGFSLLELTIALALTLTLMTAIFSVVQQAHGSAAAQPETADMQQRLRVAVDTLTLDLMMAGAGPHVAGHRGPLNQFIPGVLPFRSGMAGGDPAGTFRSDTITVIHVPTTAAQTDLAADFVPGSQTMEVARLPWCATGTNLCSFSAGMTLLAFDAGGAFQTFSVAAVIDAASQLSTTSTPSTIYKAGTPVVEAQAHTYSLKVDAQTGTYQLMRSDGTANADVPVLDHVVALTFEYFGDPALGAPVPVRSVELIDGPWRPDDASADRWDVDLLRIRTIAVTVRVEAAAAALRGPAGALFANAGTATRASVWVPDQTLHFVVSPRNLNLRP
jgi:Tfp pilus assembly protein PilW